MTTIKLDFKDMLMIPLTPLSHFPSILESWISFSPLAPFLFIICQDYILELSVYLMKYNSFTLKRQEADNIQQQL